MGDFSIPVVTAASSDPARRPPWRMDREQILRALAADPYNRTYRRLYLELTGDEWAVKEQPRSEARPWLG